MGLRVLQVLEPGTDGVFRHVEGLCRFLMESGHEVHLAYSSVRGSDRLDELVRRVLAKGGRTCDLCTGNSPAWSDLRALVRLRRIIHQTKPMVMHAHSSKAGALARLLSVAGLRVPVVYTPNAYYGMSRGRGLKTAVFNAVERGLGRIGWTINVSDDEAEWAWDVLRLPKSHSRVIPNSVDTNHFIPGTLSDRSKLRQTMGWPDNAIVLGTVGRLSLQKDPVTLYRAVGRLMSVEPRLHFLHVGRGELLEEVEAIVREVGFGSRVRRIDYLADTVSFYQGVDGFASTSIYEGLPIAVLEALSAGLPLLLSDVPGNRGFRQLGLSRLYMAPAREVESWGLLIQRWFRQHILDGPGSLGSSNHRTIAHQHFSFQAGYGQVLKLYNEIISESARSGRAA